MSTKRYLKKMEQREFKKLYLIRHACYDESSEKNEQISGCLNF